MEKKKPWIITAAIVASVQLLVQVLTLIFVLRLNMLPTEYIVVLILGMVLLLEATAMLMFIPVKDRIRLWRKIVSCVLAAAIMAGCVFASRFAWKTYHFVDEISGGNFIATKAIRVLVLNESPAQKLADTKGCTYGVMPDYDAEHTQQMVTAVKTETGGSASFTNYQQITAMVDALYNGQLDALILHDASISLLVEQDGYQDFMSRARILHTLTIEEKVEVNVQPPREDLPKSCFIIYISGSDTRSKILDVSRSDVNILAVVNPNTKQILLVNTPRDYYIPHPNSKNGSMDKLTHCGNSGVGCSIKALETLYDAKIDYYAQINFTGFEKLVDAIGGITVYSDQSFYTVEGGSYIQKGENQLNGEKALQFARERYNLRGGDNDRGKNQMKIIKAIVEKLTSSSALITNYADILKSLEKMFVTNFHMEEISDLVKMQLSDMATWDVQSYAVTGKGSSEWCYSWSDYQLSVTIPDQATVDYAQTLIDRVLAGQKLTAEDVILPKE